MLDVSDLIGIPYKEHGRDLSGFDCYGLAIEVERRFGKVLIDVFYHNHDAELSQMWAPLLNVRRIDSIIEGALIEIHIGTSLHIGVALNDSMMIHATTNQGVRISRIKAYKVAAVYEVL